MIDTKELRIGNWVLYQDEPQEVYNIHPAHINEFKESDCGEEIYFEHLDPIPLTEETLLKCGFGRKSHKWKDGSISNVDWWKDNISVTIEDWGQPPFVGRKTHDNMPTYICPVLYLHQLQNAFFILTGKELEIKL